MFFTFKQFLNLVFFVQLVWFGSNPTVEAWKDEGHMLVAAIAKLSLYPAIVDSYERLLALFPDNKIYNTMISTAVWPDHIKQQDFNVLNQWHWVSIPYNPEKLIIPLPYALLPYPNTGAIWTLSSFFGNELRRVRATSEATAMPTLKSTDKLTPAPRSLGSDGKYKKSSENFEPFAWNIKIRYLIHVLGDLHQPLHACELFSTEYPTGNLGGTKVRVDMSATNIQTHMRHLHDIWDSCGGQFTKSYPELTEIDVEKKAQEWLIQSNIPVCELSAATIFEDVANESHKLCIKHTYKDFKNKDGTWITKSAIPYKPTQEYVDMVQRLCQKRIVLAGQRLAQIMRDLAPTVRSVLARSEVRCEVKQSTKLTI